jgi:hypothetical protein
MSHNAIAKGFSGITQEIFTKQDSMSPSKSAKLVKRSVMAVIVFDECVAVLFDWLEHSFPYSFGKTSYNCVVMVQILLGSLVMVSNGEHRGSKLV